jgi:hypothetical protein
MFVYFFHVGIQFLAVIFCVFSKTYTHNCIKRYILVSSFIAYTVLSFLIVCYDFNTSNYVLEHCVLE